MLAAVAESWSAAQLARVIGISAQAGQVRVLTARRRYGQQRPGLVVPRKPPARPPRQLAVLARPVQEREWLSLAEAVAYAGACEQSVAQWRRDGLLPNTQHISDTRKLYLRADLRRVLHAPRRGKVGVDRAALRATLAQLPC